MRFFRLIFPLASALAFGVLRATEISRDQVPAEFKWNLSPVFSNWADWEKAVQELEAKGNDFASLQGTPGRGVRELLIACERFDEIGRLQQRTFRYVQLQLDVATADSGLQKKLQRMQEVLTRTYGETIWFKRELRSVPRDQLQRWINATPSLQPYRFLLLDVDGLPDDGPKGDAALTATVKAADEAVAAYLRLSSVDTSAGAGSPWDRSFAAGVAGYSSVITSDSRQGNRARVAAAFFGGLKRNQDDYAGLYRTILERDWALAQVGGFKSSFAFAVDSTGVPVAQIENFLSEVRKNTAPLRRYEELRKRVMRLENYHRYDASVPLWSGGKNLFGKEAKSIIVTATKPLGPEYAQKLDGLFRPGWVDLYPCDGKRAGAYAAGVYGEGSFLLLNSHDDLMSIFSLAHEAGHGVHAILSGESQVFSVSEPPVFLAEIASTLHEQLVYACLLGRVSDREARRELLDYRARSIISAFYTQAIWADFELRAHQLVEQGRPVTADSLNQLYASVLKGYYGDIFAGDDFADTEWAAEPHLFTAPFYVYQYATSFALSLELSRQLLGDQGPPQSAAIKSYLALLKSGGNGRAVDLLQQNGLTLKPELAHAVSDELATIVTALEKNGLSVPGRDKHRRLSQDNVVGVLACLPR